MVLAAKVLPLGLAVVLAGAALGCSSEAPKDAEVHRAAVAAQAGNLFPFQDPGVAVDPSQWTEDDGVDIATRGGACGDGATLVAIGDGSVIAVGIQGFGPWAPVIHMDTGPFAGRNVYYGHARPNLVNVGDYVHAGQPVAQVGCGIVGESTGPHLEIGVSVPGSNVSCCPPKYATSGEMHAYLLDAYQNPGAPVGSDGCTADEDAALAQFACQCVDHQGNGGFCPGTGCTGDEAAAYANFGCQCVDHQGNGGFCPGPGCTAREQIDAAQFGCQCVDHQPNGGFCPGSGCTAKEQLDAAQFGCDCVDHKPSGGFCPGSGCTAREEVDCSSQGKGCSLHHCL